ncbi:hypothetical protein Tco_0948187 [Tanacetum coccineum]
MDYFISMHYGIIVKNGGGRAVQLKFSSQSTTTALSIENGSLFEGESEFENLLHHTRFSSNQSYLCFNQSWNDMTLIKANVLSNIVSLPCLFPLLLTLMQNSMAEQNVPTQAPARTDEQIVPRSQWLQIGKSNLLFDAQKIQKNPIFQISTHPISDISGHLELITNSSEHSLLSKYHVIYVQTVLNDEILTRRRWFIVCHVVMKHRFDLSVIFLERH